VDVPEIIILKLKYKGNIMWCWLEYWCR